MTLELIWTSYQPDDLPRGSETMMMGVHAAFLASRLSAYPIDFICSARTGQAIAFAQALDARIRNWREARRCARSVCVVPYIAQEDLSTEEIEDDTLREFRASEGDESVDSENNGEFTRVVIPALAKLVWHRHRMSFDGTGDQTYYVVVVCSPSYLWRTFAVRSANEEVYHTFHVIEK